MLIFILNISKNIYKKNNNNLININKYFIYNRLTFCVK